MTQAELILLNFKEIRRRSILLWQSLPVEYYEWKPDAEAMSASGMIRHVLEADYGWNIIVNQGRMENYNTPWENRVFTNVQEELEFAAPYRNKFLESVGKFTDEEIQNTMIIHPGNSEPKNLGKYLLRIGYHESVHAGNFLTYLRLMGLERPNIWD